MNLLSLYSKYSKNYKIYIIFIGIFLMAVNINLIVFNYINIKNGYYIGKIKALDKSNETTTMIVTPLENNREFASNINSNHKIQYSDNIMISGLCDKNKKRKDLYLGQLSESIEILKVGDPIIFKAVNYDKENYILEISEIAVDLTLE